MPLLNLLVILICAGVVLWLINSFIPMDGKIKKIVNAVFVIVLVIWMLSLFGVLGHLSGVHIGRS